MAEQPGQVRRLLGAVLAGGRSTRFGRDKSQALIDGVSLLERVRAVVAQVTDAVVVVGGSASEIAESEPGGGPLQAVIAALDEAARRGYEGALVLACDLPLIDHATVARLTEPLPPDMIARVPRIDGQLQVLAGCWSVRALGPLVAAWEAGERSLTRACSRLPIEARGGWSALALADADTRAALDRLLAVGPISEVEVRRWPAGETSLDAVAREEPLEIVVDGEPLAVLLRTPSGGDDDLALAAGFLLAEGVIDRLEDLDALAPCTDPAAEHRDNRVLATLAPGVSVPEGARRLFVSGSSCGLCGKAAIDALARRLPERGPAPGVTAAVVSSMDLLVRSRQAGFDATGALHAAALFRGDTLADLAEDVGRHNAVDKIFGRALMAGRLPLHGAALWVSGRVSFEIAQKALVAGVDALVAVGAPTSMAIALAAERGLNLIGFARSGRFNVYAGALSSG